MARPLKPLVKSGGYYPSRKWTPLVYRGGYTTANGGGEQPDPVEKTVSGAIVHITDALAAPVSALSVAIEPVQSGSGDPSPSNIRPISGWTGANIHVSPTTDAQDGTTYSITFPSAAGTVYGGTLDVTTGVMTVDMAMVDMGTLTWTGWEQGGSIIFYSHIPDKMPVRDIPCISSQYAYNSAITGSWSDLLNGELTGQSGGDNVYVRDARYSSIADFKTAMSGVQLVYPLDTPIEYTLTPTEVTTLLGENNIWADAGDVTVTYIADGNASDAEALGILLGGRYTPSDDVTDKEALDIILGGTE